MERIGRIGRGSKVDQSDTSSPLVRPGWRDTYDGGTVQNGGEIRRGNDSKPSTRRGALQQGKPSA